MGANGSPWTSLYAVKGRMKYDLPVLVVLLFEPKPPKPVPCCCWLFCPNPEKDMMNEDLLGSWVFLREDKGDQGWN